MKPSNHLRHLFINGWPSKSNSETICGPGSTISNTEEIRNFLPLVIKKYNIKTINDAGCGDFNWMSHIDLSDIDYMGYDLVVRPKALSHKSENIKFQELNIVEEYMRSCDLTICRDVMFHLTNEMVLEVLRNISRASKYLLSTYFDIESNEKRTDYTQKNQGNTYFQRINLCIKPFNLGSPIEYINEPAFQRKMGIWMLNKKFIKI